MNRKQDQKRDLRRAYAIDEARRKARKIGGYATVYGAATYYLVETHETEQPPRGGIIHGIYDAAGRDFTASAERANLIEAPQPGRRYLHAYTYRSQPVPVLATRVLADERIEIRNEQTGNVALLDRGTRLPPATEPASRRHSRRRQQATSTVATG